MRGALARLFLLAMRPQRMRHFRALERTQFLPPAAIAARSEALLAAMLSHASRAVPFYRDHAAAMGADPSTLTAADLERFPTVDKVAITAGGEAFLAAGLPASRRIANSTGGSSGVMFRFFNDRRHIGLRAANDLRSRAWTGWRPGDPQAILWGHPGDNARAEAARGRLLARHVHRSLTLNAFELTTDGVTEFVARVRDFAPTMLLGYASALDLLARHLEMSGERLLSPQGLISSAETLLPEHRTQIEKVFGCPLLNRYGSREFGVIAQQCGPNGGLHVFTDQVHVEIVGPEGRPVPDGEPGEVVITDLWNHVMPLIRYRTGDMARRHPAPCTCGRGFPLLAAVEGRTSEVIVGRDGQLYSCPGPRFYTRGINGVGQMQLIQDSVTEITVRIVPDGDWHDGSKAQVVSRMRDLLGDVAVHVEIVDAIAPSPSGKFRFAISSVSPFSAGSNP